MTRKQKIEILELKAWNGVKFTEEEEVLAKEIGMRKDE